MARRKQKQKNRGSEARSAKRASKPTKEALGKKARTAAKPQSRFPGYRQPTEKERRWWSAFHRRSDLLRTMVHPPTDYRKLHLHIRELAKKKLGTHYNPQSWRPRDKAGLTSQLARIERTCGVPARDLGEALFRVIPRSWSGVSKRPQMPSAVRQMLFEPLPVPSLDGEASPEKFRAWDQSLTEEQTRNRRRSRGELQMLVTRHQPDSVQLAAIVAAVLEVLDKPYKSAIRKYGEQAADTLASLRDPGSMESEDVRVAVTGAVWHQLWGDADGSLFYAFSRFQPQIGNPDMFCHWHEFYHRVRSTVVRLVQDDELTEWAAVVGRRVGGVPNTVVIPKKRRSASGKKRHTKSSQKPKTISIPNWLHELSGTDATNLKALKAIMKLARRKRKSGDPQFTRAEAVTEFAGPKDDPKSRTGESTIKLVLKAACDAGVLDSDWSEDKAGSCLTLHYWLST